MTNSIKSALITVVLAVAAIIMVSMTSCSSTEPQSPMFNTFRVKVLENNTISFVRVPKYLSAVYTYGDTVWVNFDRHLIDDTCNTTMQCVLQPYVTKMSYEDVIDVDGTDSINTYTIYDADHQEIGVVKANRLDSLINADNL